MSNAWIVAFVIGLACGSVVTNWNRNADEADLKKQYAEAEQKRAEQHSAQLKEIQAERDDLQVQLDQIDTHGYGELTHAKNDIDRLTVELATAERRLSVRTSCPAAKPSSVPKATVSPRVDDGAGTRADIHPADAAAIIRVTGDADRCSIKLTALQQWARTVSNGSR